MKTDTPASVRPADDGRRVWDRQPGETAPAFSAFTTYLDLGEGRTVAAAYRLHRGKPPTVRPSGRFVAWARAHDWHARADAYDLHVRRERIAAFVALDLTEHLDIARLEAVDLATAEAAHSRRLLARGERMIERFTERIESPEYAPTVREIKDVLLTAKTLGEHAINSKGVALGLHQILGLLTGETPLDLSADASADGASAFDLTDTGERVGRRRRGLPVAKPRGEA